MTAQAPRNEAACYLHFVPSRHTFYVSIAHGPYYGF